MGKLLKGLVTVTTVTAAVGGLCYVFRDQIKDSKVYKDHNVDEKIKKVKTTIKEKMPKIFDNEEDIVDDGEIFFDDLDAAAAQRDYVSINPEEAAEDTAKEVADEATEKTEE